MNLTVSHRFLSSFLIPFSACLLLVCIGGVAFGQAGAPGAPPVPAPAPVQQPAATPTGNTGGDGIGGDGELEEIEPIRLIREIEDRRNQGFVGPTAPGIVDTGFMGPQTGEPDGDVAEGRFVGGGTNEGLGFRSATASTPPAPLDQNGFIVQRRSMRSRLRPSFAAPSTPSFVTAQRFQSRMTRQPVVRNFAQGVTISVANRTAVLSGVVNSNAERSIIKRQLMLEPGVYRIDDRTTVAR